MSEENQQGVVVTMREIYNSVNAMNEKFSSLTGTLERLEQQNKEQNSLLWESKKRSHQAINQSNEAKQIASEAQKDADEALNSIQQMKEEKYKEQKDTANNERNNRIKFYITLVGAIVPYLILIGIGLIYFAKTGGF